MRTGRSKGQCVVGETVSVCTFCVAVQPQVFFAVNIHVCYFICDTVILGKHFFRIKYNFLMRIVACIIIGVVFYPQSACGIFLHVMDKRVGYVVV